jgi:hypothetical protein
MRSSNNAPTPHGQLGCCAPSATLWLPGARRVRRTHPGKPRASTSRHQVPEAERLAHQLQPSVLLFATEFPSRAILPPGCARTIRMAGLMHASLMNVTAQPGRRIGRLPERSQWQAAPGRRLGSGRQERVIVNAKPKQQMLVSRSPAPSLGCHCPHASPPALRPCSALLCGGHPKYARLTQVCPPVVLTAQVYVPPHPLVKHWVAVARNATTPTPMFRRQASRLDPSAPVPLVSIRACA